MCRSISYKKEYKNSLFYTHNEIFKVISEHNYIKKDHWIIMNEWTDIAIHKEYILYNCIIWLNILIKTYQLNIYQFYSIFEIINRE